jgi:2-enoate reductase
MTPTTKSRLFEPIRISKVNLKNRIAMAPMGIIGLADSQGGFSDRAVDYYVERAKGGTGLIITGLVKIENEIEGSADPRVPIVSLNPRHFRQTGVELTETVHAYGTKIFMMLTAGSGRSANPAGLLKQPVAPSAIPNYWNPGVTCRELTTAEVEKLVLDFGRAAEMAVESGFDGVEIHAVHEGYLVDQFTIAFFNRRTDKYGGDLRGRLTFPIEIVREIKKQAGKDFPVSLRFSIKSYVKDFNKGGLPGEDFVERGRDTEEGLEAATIFEAAGYDSFNADAGTYDAWYWPHPPRYQEHGLYLPLTEQLKKVVKVPVIVAGRLEIPELAEKALDNNQADIIALGRGLLADPYWPKKVRAGKIQNIRPCLGCHDGCMGRISLGRPLSCAVNPACGRERQFAIQPARETKKVMVIGGGVAGMEVARIATMRGHQVTLYEKNRELGGHVIEASVPDFKKDDARLLDWYKNELKELKVKIKLGRAVSPELVETENPDVVVVATGSKPIMLDIPGIKKGKVATAIDILMGKKGVGATVAIIGGGLVGCETALWLAKQGKKVTIIEMLGGLMQAGLPVPWPNKSMLLDLLEFNKVNIIPNTTVLEVTDDGVTLINNRFTKSTLQADTVILAVGLKADQELYNSLVDKVPDIHLIGDARQAQNIMYAIWDANELARSI